MKDKKAVSAKIVKLLNLARSTTSQHEAEAALAKAKELLDTYNLNEGEASVYAEGIIEQFSPYGWTQRPRWVADLVSTIAYHFNVRSYINESFASWFSRYHGFYAFCDAKNAGKMSDDDYNLKGFVLIGLDVDVEIAGLAYDYARHTMHRMSNKYARQFPVEGRYVARMSYAEGLVQGLSQALCNKGRGAGAVSGPAPSVGTELMRMDELVKTKFDLIDEYLKRKIDLRDMAERECKTNFAAMEQGESDGRSLELARGLRTGTGSLALEG